MPGAAVEDAPVSPCELDGFSEEGLKVLIMLLIAPWKMFGGDVTSVSLSCPGLLAWLLLLLKMLLTMFWKKPGALVVLVTPVSPKTVLLVVASWLLLFDRLLNA